MIGKNQSEEINTIESVVINQGEENMNSLITQDQFVGRLCSSNSNKLFSRDLERFSSKSSLVIRDAIEQTNWKN